MHKRRSYLSVFITVSALMVFGAAVYRFPPVNQRLAWRVELAKAQLMGMIDPAGPVPTPLALPSATLAATAAPSPTPTLTATPRPTQPGPTSTPLPSPTPLPEVVSLSSPAWERQDLNNCGPASLSMYLRYYGWQGDQFTISELLKPLREDRNVNVEELIYYVRNRAGWLNAEFRVGGDIQLLKELLAAGFPVLVEEGMQMDEPVAMTNDYWAAHYLLLTGYDDARQVFTAQDSYVAPDLEVSYTDLDSNWKAFNRVYVVVYLPGQEETLKTILGEHWDMAASRQSALEMAQAEIEADPQDAFAWFNLGSNYVYFQQYEEAARAYDQARTIGLPLRMLRYQFGPFFAYFHSYRTEELMALAEHALKVTRNAEEALLWRGWGRYRQGDTQGAIADWREALKANPNYGDAKYALEFVGAQ